MKGNSSVSFSHEHTAKSSPENNMNKLRLFGVVLDPVLDSTQGHETGQTKGSLERDESVNSSAASSTVTDIPSSNGGDDVAEEKTNKFVCQYCLKAFGNSQALGGHQNAHKKERMKKKRLQLQARKASINCYIQPFHNNSNKISSNYNGRNNNPVWFYDPSCHAPEFSLYEEPQISFGPYGSDLERNSPEQLSRWYAALPDRIPSQQQGTRAFSLTRGETQEAKNKHVSTSKKKSSCNRKILDLQLGLALH